MASPSPATVVIECPHCRTRYQVAPETIGSTGRKVQCAHCGKSWQALAEPPRPLAVVPKPQARRAPRDTDTLFDEVDERALDAAFVAEQEAVAPPAVTAEVEIQPPEVLRSIDEIRAAIAPRPPVAEPEPGSKPEPAPERPRPETAAQKKIMRAFDKRRRTASRNLPIARVRRAARIAGVAGLVILLSGGLLFRTEIVRAFPDMAGVYAALGMGVNVVGLNFSDVTTLISRKDGATVMSVDATISSVETHAVAVPPVVVTLLGADGQPLYEWSVTPDAADLRPGEMVKFSTRLNAPPAGVTHVRLTFGNGRAQSETPIANAVKAEGPA